MLRYNENQFDLFGADRLVSLYIDSIILTAYVQVRTVKPESESHCFRRPKNDVFARPWIAQYGL